MTPHRRAVIDAHIAETRRLMVDCAFELNDLVRFALSASRDKGQKVYYPMDPVGECIRRWEGLAKKRTKLVARIECDRARLGAPPFDAEAPVSKDAADGDPR